MARLPEKLRTAVHLHYAEGYSTEEIAALLGADSLGYLPLTDLEELVGHSGYCSACFDGRYPTAIPRNTQKDRFERKLSEVHKNH